MIRGRTSESRRAVARLIGKRRSVGARGAGLRLRPVARGFGAYAGLRPCGSRVEAGGGEAGGRAVAPRPLVGAAGDGDCDGRLARLAKEVAAEGEAGGGKARPLCFKKRAMAGDTDDGGGGGNRRPPWAFPGSTVGGMAAVGKGGKGGGDGDRRSPRVVPGWATGGAVAAGKGGVWAVPVAGSIQESSTAMTAIDGRTCIFFMRTPLRSVLPRRDDGCWSFRSESSVRWRADQNQPPRGESVARRDR